MRSPLTLKITGWFQVGWSADIGTGDVVPMRYFGQDLVAYRGLDGVLRVHDAHCQHLGANLASGGCVVADGIQCPFHGWVWDPVWEHQIYLGPPGLATSEAAGFRKLRRWATQFYPAAE